MNKKVEELSIELGEKTELLRQAKEELDKKRIECLNIAKLGLSFEAKYQESNQLMEQFNSKYLEWEATFLENQQLTQQNKRLREDYNNMEQCLRDQILIHKNNRDSAVSKNIILREALGYFTKSEFDILTNTIKFAGMHIDLLTYLKHGKQLAKQALGGE
jgi:hypothetical protein